MLFPMMAFAPLLPIPVIAPPNSDNPRFSTLVPKASRLKSIVLVTWSKPSLLFSTILSLASVTK